MLVCRSESLLGKFAESLLREKKQHNFCVKLPLEKVGVANGINKIPFLAFKIQSLYRAHCTKRRTSLTVWQNLLAKYL
jgi:hypothetical protein